MSDGFEKMGATALAIDLRVRLLEVLVGLDTPMARMDKMKKSISRRAHDVVEEVYQALDAAGLEAVKRFLEGCSFPPWIQMRDSIPAHAIVHR